MWDGKHGNKSMTFFRVLKDGTIASIGPKNDRWKHAHPQTTTYGTMVAMRSWMVVGLLKVAMRFIAMTCVRLKSKAVGLGESSTFM